MFSELPPSMRTQLSLTFFKIELTMRGYQPDLGMKFRWSIGSKVIRTSYHFKYSGVADPTSRTSRAVSFSFLLDS
jgi:hypothetical protein